MLTKGLSQIAPGFGQIVDEVGSTIERAIGAVRTAGEQSQGQVSAAMADGTRDSSAQIGTIAANARTEMADVASNEGDSGSWWSWLDDVFDALAGIGKTWSTCCGASRGAIRGSRT